MIFWEDAMTVSQISAGGSSLQLPTDAFPWPVAPLNLSRLYAYLDRCVSLGIGYGLGATAHNLTALPPDYSEIDCSGWVRAAVAVASGGRTILPDGSVNQHDWCDKSGLKVSSRAALLLPDNYTRICFIVPTPEHEIGHVFLCRNLKTLESWGGHGPGSRSVLSHISLGILQGVTSAVYILGANQ
jgi:hypothetical protein